MWYEDRQNLVLLANYLKDDGEWREYSTKEHKDDPVRRMIYFLSKPWKWQDEWDMFQQTRSKPECQQKL